LAGTVADCADGIKAIKKTLGRNHGFQRSGAASAEPLRFYLDVLRIIGITHAIVSGVRFGVWAMATYLRE